MKKLLLITIILRIGCILASGYVVYSIVKRMRERG